MTMETLNRRPTAVAETPTKDMSRFKNVSCLVMDGKSVVVSAMQPTIVTNVSDSQLPEEDSTVPEKQENPQDIQDDPTDPELPEEEPEKEESPPHHPRYGDPKLPEEDPKKQQGPWHLPDDSTDLELPEEHPNDTHVADRPYTFRSAKGNAVTIPMNNQDSSSL